MDKNRLYGCTNVKELSIAINEDSIRDRKKRVRSSMQIQQLQKFYLISSKKVDNLVPDKKFSKHTGSTRGNLIAFVNLPSLDAVWALPPDVRERVYGSRRVSSGNAAEDDDRDPSDATPSAVFYHATPSHLWKDLGQAFQAKAFLDLAAGSGEVAKAALQLRLPCLALCLTDEHQVRLMDHLVEFMQESMLDTGSTFQNQAYITFKKGKPGPTPKPTPKPPPKKRSLSRSPSAKPKKPKKNKKRGKSSSSSSSDSDS
jgi:hypothetical protein